MSDFIPLIENMDVKAITNDIELELEDLLEKYISEETIIELKTIGVVNEGFIKKLGVLFLDDKVDKIRVTAVIKRGDRL